MKKILLGAAVAMLGIAPALAADMAPKYTKAPMAAPVPIDNWSGFYIGLNAGGSWSDNRRDYTMPFTTPGNVFANCASPVGVAPLVIAAGLNPFDISAGCSRPSSFIGGAQVGYNWQAGTWVFGLEADGAWQSLIERSFTRFGTNTTVNAPMGSVATDTAFFKSEATGLGTFRGRVGYAPGPWMVYATGGLAVGNVKHTFTEVLAPGNACVTPAGNTCRTVSDDDTKVGWTVGAGFEWMFARNWSIGAEYLYVDLGRTTMTLAPVAGGVIGVTNFFFNTSTARFDDREHVARVKLNYHFNSPVVARY
jgi:outer membrane immunogenic protein